MSSYKKLSTMVPNTVPNFVSNDYPLFVEFMVKYYESLEQSDGPYRMITEILENRNILRSNSDFVDNVKQQLAPLWPSTTSVKTLSDLDFRNVARNVLSFNRRKSLDDSFSYLFKILLESDVSLDYALRDCDKIIQEYIDVLITDATILSDPSLLEGRTFYTKWEPNPNNMGISIGYIRKYESIAGGIHRLHIEDVVGVLPMSSILSFDSVTESNDLADIVCNTNGVQYDSPEWIDQYGNNMVDPMDISGVLSIDDPAREFIYFIQSERTIDDFRTLVKDLIHPAGYHMFTIFNHITADESITHVSDVSTISIATILPFIIVLWRYSVESNTVTGQELIDEKEGYLIYVPVYVFDDVILSDLEANLNYNLIDIDPIFKRDFTHGVSYQQYSYAVNNPNEYKYKKYTTYDYTADGFDQFDAYITSPFDEISFSPNSIITIT